jgi:hypothetical protein
VDKQMTKYGYININWNTLGWYHGS